MTSERAHQPLDRLSAGVDSLGYLIGAIPFGYLVFRQVKGIDIRTVGSGNIGATNVGRLLGFRYFLLVFALDVLKGFVPTFGVPLVLEKLGTSPPAELPVFVAMAAILGHNFPVYLGFKGGKGVATSLGALLALDPIACAAAAAGFFLVFLPTRYVSLSSIAGALAFVAGHFSLDQGALEPAEPRHEHPGHRDRRPARHPSSQEHWPDPPGNRTEGAPAADPRQGGAADAAQGTYPALAPGRPGDPGGGRPGSLVLADFTTPAPSSRSRRARGPCARHIAS